MLCGRPGIRVGGQLVRVHRKNYVVEGGSELFATGHAAKEAAIVGRLGLIAAHVCIGDAVGLDSFAGEFVVVHTPCAGNKWTVACFKPSQGTMALITLTSELPTKLVKPSSEVLHFQAWLHQQGHHADLIAPNAVHLFNGVCCTYRTAQGVVATA